MATEKSEYVLAVSRHMRYFSSTRSMMKVQNGTDKENLMSTSCVLVTAATKNSSHLAIFDGKRED